MLQVSCKCKFLRQVRHVSGQKEAVRGQGGWRVIEGEPQIEVWEVTNERERVGCSDLGSTRLRWVLNGGLS